MRTRILKALMVVAAMIVAGPSFAAPTVTVGSTNFTEQIILANIYADVLEAHGVNVEVRPNLGSREIVFPALKAGEIDIIPEYTGALLAYLSGEEKVTAHTEKRCSTH